MDEQFMPRSSEVVEKIRNERGWTQEHLADLTGYSRQQTAKYCVGSATPPTEFLAALYRETGDARLVRLITTAQPISIYQTPKDQYSRKRMGDADVFEQSIRQAKQQNDAMASLLELLADGIDPSDPHERERLDDFNRRVGDALTSLATLEIVVNATFNARMFEHESAKSRDGSDSTSGNVCNGMGLSGRKE